MKNIEHDIHRVFQISIILKGLQAAMEILGGLFFYVVSTQAILQAVNRLTLTELTEDPRDFVAAHLLSAAQNLTGATEHFYAYYLISHGVIKVLLVIGLLREMRIAYPVSLAAMAGFIAYQLYRYSYTHSAMLILLTVFDLVVCALIWHEWRQKQRLTQTG
ncbi:DUF2127 domain-containing protein [Pseudooceanicola spongiae]|uniref:DUF2127 domain-containing protein n=1 Tax=Pseudooceanicola spongiae TaxID=2613965 RepID=A0A7L9WLC1_9RHOB|nr:DUF2127 domain-containing protein [Pseudooceanicola spongiae]QOL80713.1 DUF2127 domain-containing protein [Pseudooceanicola spongiae]